LVDGAVRLTPAQLALLVADSDEVAQAIRDDVAHGYEMISPGVTR
jgi:hypothetical protein